MNFRQTTMLALTLATMLTACGGAQEPKDGGLTKADAKALLNGSADNNADNDTICSDNGFNDDGVCDDWCPDGDDADCATSNTCANGDQKVAPDGCNTCICGEGVWACTEIDCADPDPDPDPDPNPDDDTLTIEIGDCSDLPDDPFDIQDATIKGDLLTVEVGHSGGCAEHVFTACWDGLFMESYPVQTQLVVSHDANGDLCEAYGMRTLKVDLTPMRDAYEAGYQTTEGEKIIVHVGTDGDGDTYEL